MAGSAVKWRSLSRLAQKRPVDTERVRDLLDECGHDYVASGIDWLWAPHAGKSHREQAARNLQTLAQRMTREFEVREAGDAHA